MKMGPNKKKRRQRQLQGPIDIAFLHRSEIAEISEIGWSFEVADEREPVAKNCQEFAVVGSVGWARLGSPAFAFEEALGLGLEGFAWGAGFSRGVCWFGRLVHLLVFAL